MQPVSASPTAPASGAPYQLTQSEMVRKGRWRAYWRAFWVTVFLVVLALPSRLVATDHLASVDGSIPDSVPVRMSLLIDAAMILAYVVLAVRAWDLVPFAVEPVPFAPDRPTRQRRWARAALALVVLGALGNAAQDVYLWFSVGPGDSAVIHTPWALAHWAAALVGLGLGYVAAVRENARHDDAPHGGGLGPAGPDLVVCCSGGGIRAASFCLGGLQALKDRYRMAGAVVGVSGGGYIAAAFHVHRWKSASPGGVGQPKKDEWGEQGRAYAPGTPEEAWLRRHTRYLVDSPGSGVFALLSLLYGLAVNLLFITAVLGGTAWLAAWFFLASGGITGWDGGKSVALRFGEGWGWVRWVWVVAAVGVVLFFVGKAVDRFPTTPGTLWRNRVRTGIVALVVVGAALTAALLVLPWLLDRLHDFARGSHTGPLAHALDQLLTAMGFAAGSDVAAPSVAVPSASFVAIVAAVVASLRAISASLTPADGKRSPVGKALAAVWGKVKGVVIPWLAAVAVITLLVAVFFTWTVALLNDPTHLQAWQIVWGYILLVAVAYLFTDANRTSLHHYYRERLASAYLVGQNEAGLPEPVDYHEPLRYSDSAPGDEGPSLVTCAVANVSDIDVVPTGRDCTPFVFSHDRIGLTESTLPDTAQVESRSYEYAADGRGREATIPAAVAISGAAFSPLAGRENVRIRPYRLMLALANARLGVWLPNPLWVDERLLEARRKKRFRGAVEQADRTQARQFREAAKDMLRKPSPFLVAREGFGRTSVLDRYLYVTDGGHYDNLGLVEALRRRARTILVLDASNDDEDTFQALGQAIATARMDLDCEVHIDPRDMRRVKKGRAKAAWVRGTVTYHLRPGQVIADTGELWVAKAVMLDGLPWDVETYQGNHPEFPRTSTGRQLYGEFDLEAYRELGCAVVDHLLVEADKRPDSRLSRDWPRNRTCPECETEFDVVTARDEYNAKYRGKRDYDEREHGRRCAACAIGRVAEAGLMVAAAR